MSSLATALPDLDSQRPLAAPEQVWRQTFLRWPEGLPRRGVLVTRFDEQIPFSNFWASAELLLLERTNPDSLGSRKILLSFAEVAAVKFTDVLKPKAFVPLGFEAPAKKKSSADPS